MGEHWWDNAPKWETKAPKTPAILRSHARKRAVERYNVRLNRKHIRAIVEAIRTGKAERMRKQSNNRSLWKVVLHDVTFFPVYDKRHGTVATFLDEKMVKELLANDEISVDKHAEAGNNEGMEPNTNLA